MQYQIWEKHKPKLVLKKEWLGENVKLWHDISMGPESLKDLISFLGCTNYWKINMLV